MILLPQLNEIRSLLGSARTIAVVGLSPKHERPSNMVARYLLETGYTLYPVNPGHDSILGLNCYPDLLSLPVKIDIVDIFKRSEHVMPFVEHAVTIDCRAIWMQQGITNRQAAELARQNSIQIIMDRCIKIDHANLLEIN